MFKKITTSLSKPPMVIFFMKDQWSSIIFYILLLPIFMVIPTIVTLLTQPVMSASLYQDVYDSIQEEFRFDDVTLENYELSYTEIKHVSVDTFDIGIGSYEDALVMSFVFKSEGVGVYYVNQELNYYSYESLGFESHDFTSLESQDINALSLLIKDIYQEQTIFIVSEVILQYFVYVFDFLIVILIMTVLSRLLAPPTLINFPFAFRFKMSTYLSTIYIFSNFVLLLLGLYTLNFISMILVYVYHLWAYRAIKVLPKGVKPNGRK
jgi:hypothetical protein